MNHIKMFENWLSENKSNGHQVDDSKIKDIFEKLYKKYSEKDYWDLEETIENKISELKGFQKKGDKEAMKYSPKEVREMVEKNNKKITKGMFDRLVDAIGNKNVRYLKEHIRYDQKFSKEVFEEITGIKLPNTNKGIKEKLEEFCKKD